MAARVESIQATVVEVFALILHDLWHRTHFRSDGPISRIAMSIWHDVMVDGIDRSCLSPLELLTKGNHT
jgi:hypothetical protein